MKDASSTPAEDTREEEDAIGCLPHAGQATVLVGLAGTKKPPGQTVAL